MMEKVPREHQNNLSREELIQHILDIELLEGPVTISTGRYDGETYYILKDPLGRNIVELHPDLKGFNPIHLINSTSKWRHPSNVPWRTWKAEKKNEQD